MNGRNPLLQGPTPCTIFKMKNKKTITEQIFKELGHKFKYLNELYVCIEKEDLKQIKKYYSHTESHGIGVEGV